MRDNADFVKLAWYVQDGHADFFGRSDTLADALRRWADFIDADPADADELAVVGVGEDGKPAVWVLAMTPAEMKARLRG